MAQVLYDAVEQIEDKFRAPPGSAENGALAVQTKVSTHAHGGNTRVHSDNSQGHHFRRATDQKMHNCGAANGSRWIIGEGQGPDDTSTETRAIALFCKQHGRRSSLIPGVDHAVASMEGTNGWYQLGTKWVFMMNGVIRHADFQPVLGEGFRLYHQGVKMSGSCFNIIMTMTRDLNRVEAEWTMNVLLDCLNTIEKMFEQFAHKT